MAPRLKDKRHCSRHFERIEDEQFWRRKCKRGRASGRRRRRPSVVSLSSSDRSPHSEDAESLAAPRRSFHGASPWRLSRRGGRPFSGHRLAEHSKSAGAMPLADRPLAPQPTPFDQLTTFLGKPHFRCERFRAHLPVANSQIFARKSRNLRLAFGLYGKPWLCTLHIVNRVPSHSCKCK